MVKITYIEASGAEHVIDVMPGLSIMEGAVKNNVPGILADCGGACACGTCRVFVDEAWRERTGKPSDMEEAMLELHDDPSPGQRLSCQIRAVENLNGLVVRMPKSQF
ncbi:MAG: 2Fe-2S iron-sulfur cluster binding domain-containing protein [Rhodospirillaceae bacterium]|nr:MAG: 2Fe-2S iron-sulfur cluster binding domain-containing protein [Rhodospirillaceae bacterium]